MIAVKTQSGLVVRRVYCFDLAELPSEPVPFVVRGMNRDTGCFVALGAYSRREQAMAVVGEMQLADASPEWFGRQKQPFCMPPDERVREQ